MKKLFSFSILLLLLVTACKNDTEKKIETSKDSTTSEIKTLQLTTGTIEANQFEICQENDCPKVELKYLVAKGEHSERINQQNEAYLIEIFNSTPDSSSAETLDEAAKKFIKEYFNFKSS